MCNACHQCLFVVSNMVCFKWFDSKLKYRVNSQMIRESNYFKFKLSREPN